jgi:DHA2 family methylenomycin A resistance protein-like MFS transporter
MGAVDKNRAGVAAAVLNSSRQTGAALGVAIFGSLIATRHPFEVGLHAALWTAAIVSMIATLIWWFIVERNPLRRAEEPCAEQENAVTRN